MLTERAAIFSGHCQLAGTARATMPAVYAILLLVFPLSAVF